MDRKLVVLFFFFTFLISGYLFSNPVKIREIEITGNKNVETKKILKALQIKKGDEYSEEAISKGLQNIYQLGFFENITVEVTEVEGGIIVTYVVTEKPLIKRIEFKGNKKFSNTKLEKEIESKEKEPLDKKKMQGDAEKIVALYKDKGYANVKVEPYTTEDEKSGMMLVTFFITEGKQIRIGKVNLVGVETFDTKKIKKKMKTKRKKFFKQELLDEDLKMVEAYYKDRGFLKVCLGTPIVNYNEEKTEIFVTLFVYEGLKYTVGNIGFQGNSVFTSEELGRDLEIKPGEIYNQAKFEASLYNIQERYAEKGYILMRLNPEYSPDDEKKIVNSLISIEENGIVYIDQIHLEGNVITKDFVIKREFLVKEGEPFNVKKIRRTQEKLYNLGFFSDVGIEIGGTDDPHKADLICKVTEQRTGLLSMGAGYSSQDGLVGTFQITQSNLFGRGQRLDLMIEFGKKKTNYQVGFTEPWLLGKPILFGIDIFDMDRNRDYYRERRTGGDIRIGPHLTDILSLNFTYAYERIKVYDINPSYINISEGGTRDSSSFTTYLLRDSRDNIFDASRGSRNSISFQVSGGILGGETDFVKTSVSSSWFFPTFWRFVLALQLRYGIVSSFPPSTGVPIYERFYVGGADSVRGYDYRGEIGPKEGGIMMFVGNVEYKFPIVMEKGRTILQGVLFLDMGGSWRKGDVNFTIGPGDNQLKVGIGAGVRFQTPVFPVRLDWGYGLNHKPGEDKSQWYFTIGQLF
jgi:outer membrane protein insertion porin family